MPIELNHTIVAARDRQGSAEFLAATLGLQVGKPYGPFLPVQTANGVGLDYLQTDGPIAAQHYAFLVSEGEFDEILGRLIRSGTAYYAGPGHTGAGEINHEHGGRGAYFDDPNGHSLEVITRPYRSGE